MTSDTKPDKYLTFVLDAQEYGIPIASVIEINRVGEIARVPQTPVFVAGVMNLRGQVIPVVNLRVKFGFEQVPYNRETCIIVVDGECGQVGMIVDGVTRVVELAGSQIDKTPTMGDEGQLSFILGLGKLETSVVILVNVVEVLSRANMAKVMPPPVVALPDAA